MRKEYVRRIMKIALNTFLVLIIISISMIVYDTCKPRNFGPLAYDNYILERHMYGNGFQFQESESPYEYYFTKDTTYQLDNVEIRVKLEAMYYGEHGFENYGYDGVRILFNNKSDKEYFKDFLIRHYELEDENFLPNDLLLINKKKPNSRYSVRIDSIASSGSSPGVEIAYHHLFNEKQYVYVKKTGSFMSFFCKNYFWEEKDFFRNYVNKKFWPPWYENFK